MKIKNNCKLWWLQLEREVSEALYTDSHRGLNQFEAERRLKELGHNEFIEKQKTKTIHLFLCQFNSLIVLILISA